MRLNARTWFGVLSMVVMGCATQTVAPRVRTMAEPTAGPPLTCEEANRLAYRSITALGYTAAELTVARPGSPGYILARKEGAKDGRVTITCTGGGAVVIPERTGFGPPSFLGGAERPNQFPQIFRQTFGILRTRIAYEQKTSEPGLVMKLVPLNGFESQIELGADLPASGVLPIRVTIQNSTPRPYGLEVDKVRLRTAGGGRVSPLAAAPAGSGKALKDMRIEPGQTVSGFLFYPAGNYTSASTTLLDLENDEREGFSVQF